MATELDRLEDLARGDTASSLDALANSLAALRDDLASGIGADGGRFDALPSNRQVSVRNLLHYLALRRHDIRHLQDDLAAIGLSSLGRSEAHVLHSVDAVLSALDRLRGSQRPPRGSPAPIGFEEGRSLLSTNTDRLLGPPRPGRAVRIMVTMPSEAARDYSLVRELMARGMDVVRINCAHDGESEWASMIDLLHRAERDVGRPCPVLMDLAGPKLRTGAIAPSDPVVRLRPRRDALGRVTAPARVWLSPRGAPLPPPGEADAAVPIGADWLETLRPKDRVRLIDARGARRKWKVVGEAGAGRWAEAKRTAYLTVGTELENARTGKFDRIDELPPREEPIVLKLGNTLVLSSDQRAGCCAAYDESGRLLTPATVPMTLPEVFGAIRIGERIWLDDGKIGGIVRSVGPEQIQVEVTQARERGESLRSDKGINLPDTDLSSLPALTEKDLRDLEFVARHADLIGMSFVQRRGDIEALRQRLEGFGAANKGVVLKIETRRAFEALPELLLAALELPAAGVMIARGDLFVECGYERLAEVQEEILWLCEAAHLPVIWATQVLESLAQRGIPSRAEITDAAMGERAECVMLNKGPHIIEAIAVLDSILRRMQAHQSKKSSRLRRLHF
ncbi:MAG TPA: pyruvate kinase [Thermoanaerobaculia bacterium]|nr:pyruvate kinase [Thermoanaerobaculia bacterium]